jgi:hypothetical protein
MVKNKKYIVVIAMLFTVASYGQKKIVVGSGGGSGSSGGNTTYFSPRIVSLTDAATVTVDVSTTDEGVLTSLSQTTTFANPTGTPVDGQLLKIRVKSTAARALSFGNQFRASSSQSLPATTSGSTLTDRWLFEWNAADSKWDILGASLGH